MKRKKTIVVFDWHSMWNELHAEYHEVVMGLFVKYATVKTRLGAVYTKYEDALKELIKVLNLLRASEYTEDLEVIDNERDRLFNDFHETVKIASHDLDADKKRAAKKILLILKPNKRLAKKYYDAQTAATDDLIKDLKADYATEITLLGIDDWLVKIDAKNTEFKSKMALRNKQIADREKAKMVDVRKIIDDCLYDVTICLEAGLIMGDVATYQAFVDEFNTASKRYELILAQAEGRRKSKKKDNTDNQGNQDNTDNSGDTP